MVQYIHFRILESPWATAAAVVNFGFVDFNNPI